MKTYRSVMGHEIEDGVMVVEHRGAIAAGPNKNQQENLLVQCINSGRKSNILWVIFCLAMGNAADAIEIMSIGYIMAEMDNITTTEKEFLSAAVFIGMLLGSLTWGSFADILGRKPCLLASLGLNAVAGSLSALAPNVAALIVFRVIGGFGIGGTVPMIFSLGAELSPSALRGKFISLIASFWMVGALYSATSAWIMLGKNMYGDPIIPGCGWRPYAAISAIPAILSVLLTYWYIPESPRYLMDRGRFEDAVDSLRTIGCEHVTASQLEQQKKQEDNNLKEVKAAAAAATTAEGREGGRGLLDEIDSSDSSQGSSSTEDNLTTALNDHHATSGNSSSNSTNTYVESAKSEAFTHSIKKIFTGDSARTMIILSTVWFSLSFGSYGISTWIAVLFTDVGLSNPYGASFIYATANLPGNVLSFYTIETWGRKKLLSLGMVLAGVSMLGFAVDSHDAAVVVLSATLFNAFSVVGWNALDAMSAEYFPNDVRTTAMGIMAASGRFGAICAQFINGTLEDSIPLLLFVTISCTVAGGALSILLPEDSTGKSIE